MNLRPSLGALAERNFRLLFIGSATSAFGDRLVPIALAFAVLNLTGSAADLGYVLAASMVPKLLFVALGGVWADRLPRQLVMLTSDLVRCGSQAATATLLLTHQAHIWQLIVLQAIYGAAAAFFTPAAVGLTPATVSADRVQQANALMSLSRSTVGTIGPAVGGAIVVLANPGVALALDAATFAVSATALALLQLKRPTRERRTTSVFADLREGFAEVRSRAWLWPMILYFGVFNVAVIPAFFVLGPYVAKHSLGGPKAWAIILTAGALGSLIAGVLALRVRTRRPVLFSTAICLVCGLPALLLGLHAPVVVIASASLLSTCALSLADTLWHTTLQRKIPEQMISRVAAIDWTSSLILWPLGLALIGPISASIGVRTTLLASAAVTFASTLLMLTIPAIRSVRIDVQPTPNLDLAATPSSPI